MNIELFGRTFNPEQQRFAALIFFLLLLLLQTYLGPWPRFEEYLEKKTTIEANEQTLLAAVNLTTTEGEIAERERLNNEDFERMRRGIPVNTQVLSILLVDLASLAADSKVEIRRFAPSNFTLKEKAPGDESLPPEFAALGTQTIELEVNAKFPDFVQFLERLSAYEGVLQVGPPTIRPPAGASAAAEGAVAPAQPGNANRTLSINFRVTTYALDQ